MTYVLIAKWTAKEGEEEAVRAALEQLGEPSRAEPGCLMWQPHTDPENPRVIIPAPPAVIPAISVTAAIAPSLVMSMVLRIRSDRTAAPAETAPVTA